MRMDKPSTDRTKNAGAGFETTAQAYLELLESRGIEYFFPGQNSPATDSRSP
jgi:hypothetical protein